MGLNEVTVSHRQRRRTLLLHLPGTDVQDIFSTLPNNWDAKDYKKAVDALNMYFVPKVDTMIQTAYTSAKGNNSTVCDQT